MLNDDQVKLYISLENKEFLSSAREVAETTETMADTAESTESRMKSAFEKITGGLSGLSELAKEDSAAFESLAGSFESAVSTIVDLMAEAGDGAAEWGEAIEGVTSVLADMATGDYLGAIESAFECWAKDAQDIHQSLVDLEAYENPMGGVTLGSAVSQNQIEQLTAQEKYLKVSGASYDEKVKNFNEQIAAYQSMLQNDELTQTERYQLMTEIESVRNDLLEIEEQRLQVETEITAELESQNDSANGMTDIQERLIESLQSGFDTGLLDESNVSDVAYALSAMESAGLSGMSLAEQIDAFNISGQTAGMAGYSYEVNVYNATPDALDDLLAGRISGAAYGG